MDRKKTVIGISSLVSISLIVIAKIFGFFDTIIDIIIAIAAILALFGGIPKIKEKYFTAKPSLVVTESSIRANVFSVNILNEGDVSAMDVSVRWALHETETPSVISRNEVPLPEIWQIPPQTEEPYIRHLRVQSVGEFPAVKLSIRLSCKGFDEEEQLTLTKMEENTHYYYKRPD